ncbi:uncharacterized protein LOC111093101 isoform X1 [Canis lupus familiaris]|uniref:uncharacterized protein LOC111093101 isoform X1 n=1 Tax=Canis lupus familiaris TaxID=9615 RepID=UPI0018F5304E|nr:uncharacterized protein LOC111093101 isoform X1 [Canis lupus familiaris]XP_038316921.1 uncharacterized protein LOC111093101 isoform X1 [Canis lupus familiaris]XP_038435527.1 uncharacterized protein LOC111093101 isoform X1 [Canis lupus familiaris]
MLEMQQWKFYAGMKTTGKLLEREGVWRGWWSVRSQTGGLLAAFSEGTRLLLASPSSQWSRCPESTNRGRDCIPGEFRNCCWHPVSGRGPVLCLRGVALYDPPPEGGKQEREHREEEEERWRSGLPTEQGAQHGTQSQDPWNHDLSQRQMLNQQNHPDDTIRFSPLPSPPCSAPGGQASCVSGSPCLLASG